jgi:hypothetical protein
MRTARLNAQHREAELGNCRDSRGSWIGPGSLGHLNALVQAEKRQDGYDDYDCADEVDNAVHEVYLRIG